MILVVYTIWYMISLATFATCYIVVIIKKCLIWYLISLVTCATWYRVLLMIYAACLIYSFTYTQFVIWLDLYGVIKGTHYIICGINDGDQCLTHYIEYAWH